MTIFMKSVYIDFHIKNELLYRFNKYCILNNNMITGHTASNISMFYALLEQYLKLQFYRISNSIHILPILYVKIIILL